MKKVLVLKIFMSAFYLIHGQQAMITGRIVNEETGDPVPYASVVLLGSMIGTASDENGYFNIIHPGSNSATTLRISSIGYTSKEFTVKNSVASNIEIQLHPDVKLLGEVVVRQTRIEPATIIASAIDSIEVNYLQLPFNLEFYSQIDVVSLLDSSKYKLETILLGYYDGYAGSATKHFEIKAKRSSGDDPLKSINYIYWPTLELHRADLIADPVKTGILNKKNLDEFKFEYKGIVIFDNDTLFQIDYTTPHPTKKNTGYGITPKKYEGSIYITTTHYAIVRHDINTDQFTYSVIYRKVNDKYFPYYFDGVRKTTATLQWSIKNRILLRRIELQDVRVIDRDSNEFQNPQLYPQDVSFWNVNYPINDQ